MSFIFAANVKPGQRVRRAARGRGYGEFRTVNDKLVVNDKNAIWLLLEDGSTARFHVRDTLEVDPPEREVQP